MPPCTGPFGFCPGLISSGIQSVPESFEIEGFYFSGAGSAGRGFRLFSEGESVAAAGFPLLERLSERFDSGIHGRRPAREYHQLYGLQNFLFRRAMFQGLVNMVFNVGLRFPGGQAKRRGRQCKEARGSFWEGHFPGS